MQFKQKKQQPGFQNLNILQFSTAFKSRLVTFCSYGTYKYWQNKLGWRNEVVCCWYCRRFFVLKCIYSYCSFGSQKPVYAIKYNTFTFFDKFSVIHDFLWTNMSDFGKMCQTIATNDHSHLLTTTTTTISCNNNNRIGWQCIRVYLFNSH